MELFKVEILDAVVQKLKTLKNQAFGTLLTTSENALGMTVLGLIVTNTGGDDNVNIDTDLAKLHVPGGVAFFGSFYVSTENRDVDNILIVKVNPETSEITVTHGEHDEVEWSLLPEEQIAKSFFMIRTRSIIPVSLEMTEHGIREGMDNLRKKLTDIEFCELQNIPLEKAFRLPNSGKIGPANLKDIEIVELTLMMKLSASGYDNDKGMLIDCKKRTSKCSRLELPLDALTLMPYGDPASIIPELVEVQLRQSLLLYENVLISMINENDFSVPQAFHFLPETLGHFLTVVYPKKKLDKDLSEYRTFLHKAFLLPTDRPLLMRANAFSFKTEEIGSELICPHEAVAPSGIDGGEPAVVQGRYSYYHYCQQNMDDNGWGCAYRSLQTLCSWFKWQGYTNRSVPTLLEIQECLVSIGDKPPGFIGSKQWIGSTEVGFCLDTLLGVTSRFTTVNSGEDLSMKGGELTYHFRTHGTPVMIGGGNLAHTILGVDYNKKTGDIKFLILDPHYNGPEDLNVIISKGWCGWKGLNFWKKGCFYNLCMPMRPKFI